MTSQAQKHDLHCHSYYKSFLPPCFYSREVRERLTNVNWLTVGDSLKACGDRVKRYFIWREMTQPWLDHCQMMDVVMHQARKHFSIPANISTIVDESSSTQVRETRSHQNTAGPSRNVSEIIDSVFHNECVQEINNQQEEDCDNDDDCKSSGSGMNSSEGE